MEDIIKDVVFGEVEFRNNYVWVRSLEKPLFGSDTIVKVLVQDENQEGILDVQRKAYQTYLENEEKYIREVPKYILDYYKWNYEEIDRESMYNTPIEIYPDFVKAPVYTDDGIPFVTAMQKKCENYKGEWDEESTCFQCAHYEKCEELLGVCTCRERRKTS